MNTFSIVTDSSCDLPAPMAQEMDLTVLPLAFVMQGKEYYNYLDEREIPCTPFMRRFARGSPAPPPRSTSRRLPPRWNPFWQRAKTSCASPFPPA